MAPREIEARHDFCEDLAQMLVEPARIQLWDLKVTEADVLQRVHQGLLAGESPVNAAEAAWVVRRLAELLNWPWAPAPAPIAGVA